MNKSVFHYFIAFSFFCLSMFYSIQHADATVIPPNVPGSAMSVFGLPDRWWCGGVEKTPYPRMDLRAFGVHTGTTPHCLGHGNAFKRLLQKDARTIIRAQGQDHQSRNLGHKHLASAPLDIQDSHIHPTPHP